MLISALIIMEIIISVKSWPCALPISKAYSRVNSDAVLQFSADLTNQVSPRPFEIKFYDGSIKARITYNPDKTSTPEVLPGFSITGGTDGNVVVTQANVQQSNAGIYTMTAAGFSTKCNCLYILRTPRKPTVTANKTSSVGESVTLTCSSTSTTTPSNHSLSLTYSWRVDNTDNPGGAKYTYTPSKDKLTVNNIVKEDANKQFTCTATEDVTGGYTSSRSDTSSFVVYYGPDNVAFSPSDTSYEKDENESLNQVTCTASCHPTCSFTWTKTETGRIVSSSALFNLGRLQSSDAGTYRCTATRTGGAPQSKDLTVDVIYGPRNIFFNPNDVSYRHDENYNLAPITCGADCWECSYSWSGPNSFSVSGKVLDLGPLTKSMAGTYTCTARNVKLSQQALQTKQLLLEVRFGPDSIKVTNEKLVYTLDEGTRLQDIKCEADCFPVCTYKWTKGGQTIGNSDTLSLVQVQKSSTGNYTCRATNGDMQTRWREKRVTIYVRYGPYKSTTKLLPSTQNYTTNEGQNLNDITCSADCYPNCTYTWNKTRQGETTTVSSTSVLSIGELHRENAALYTCIAKNPEKISSPTTTVHTLVNVRYGPNTVSLNVKSPYEVLEGKSLIIQCKAECYPGCSYTWLNVTSGLVMNTTGSVMYIGTANKYMTGDYKCEAKNNDALIYVKSADITIRLNVKERTFVKWFYIGSYINTTNVTVDELEVGIIFTCTVSGDPAENIKITHHGQILQEKQNASSLKFIHKTVNCYDSGAFECEAKSRNMDISSKTISMFVKCSPRPVRKIRENITSVLDAPVTLTFEALAYPAPGSKGFTWYKQRQTRWLQILTNEDFQISSSGLKTNLTIFNVSENDYGQYRVTSENDFGSYNQYFYILRHEPASPKVRHEDCTSCDTLTIWIVLGTICFILIIYAASVTILWKRNVSFSKNQSTTMTMKNIGNERGNQLQEQTTYVNVAYASNDQDGQELLQRHIESRATIEDDPSKTQYTDLDNFSRDKGDNVFRSSGGSIVAVME